MMLLLGLLVPVFSIQMEHYKRLSLPTADFEPLNLQLIESEPPSSISTMVESAVSTSDLATCSVMCQRQSACTAFTHALPAQVESKTKQINMSIL
jgi:hypothetical protein